MSSVYSGSSRRPGPSYYNPYTGNVTHRSERGNTVVDTPNGGEYVYTSHGVVTERKPYSYVPVPPIIAPYPSSGYLPVPPVINPYPSSGYDDSAALLREANAAANDYQTTTASNLYLQAANAAYTSQEARKAGEAAASHYLSDAADQCFRRAADLAATSYEGIQVGNSAANNYLTDAATYAYERAADQAYTYADARQVAQAASSHYLMDAADYAYNRANQL